jgi:hypothetical protein
MNHRPAMCGLAIAMLLLAAIPNANAQTSKFSFPCQTIGSNAPEPLGDRDGHALAVTNFSCHADSGPLSGGVWTATAIWQFDGLKATLVTNNGVIRNPDGVAVFQDTQGTLTLVMANGKVTGWTANGEGHWSMATGNVANLADKSYTFAAKSITPVQFEVEITPK